MKTLLLWLGACFAALTLSFAPPSQAQTNAAFSHGVAFNGTDATLWFRSNVATTWVDAHFQLAGGGQENVRMNYNSAAGRYEWRLAGARAGQTVNYWFTYNNGNPAYDSAHFSAVISNNSSSTVSAPTFSPAPGQYSTAQSVTLSTSTAGASIRYTTDGSTPQATSKLYSGPIPVSATTTIKAKAMRSGFTDSGVSSGEYVINGSTEWNEKTTFRIENATKGRWSDAQIYWTIIGKSWQTGEFVHVDAQGNVLPMRVSDNTVPKNGRNYANYFYTLAQTKSVTIPPIDSARILMSVGSPMYIEVNTDANGRTAYAGANIENASDPNLDVIFDFGEFALLPKGHPQQGIYVNTTRVDHFGFPLKLRLQGLGGYDRTVGEPLTETRDQLFSKFVSEVPAEFRSLAEPNFPNVPARTRILAPAHATFKAGGVNANYLDSYITEMWNRFKGQDLSFTLDNLGTFRGRVDASTNRFVFTGGRFGGTYYINGQPNTAEVLLGAGKLDDPRKPDGSFQVDVPNGDPAKSIQLQIQAQVCAALNRHVLANPADWYRPTAFYPAGSKANWYAKFWHDHSIAGTEGNAAGYGLAYGFAYDDVGHFSPSLNTRAPTVVTYTIGW